MLTYPDPRTGNEAKFSLEYCAASALSPEPVCIGTFDDEAIADPTRQTLRERVEMKIDDTIPYTDTRATVKIVRTDGEILQEQHVPTPGSPDAPLTEAELKRKFDQCLRQVGRDSDDLFAALRRLRRTDLGPVVEEL